MSIHKFNLQNKNEELAKLLKAPGDFVLFELDDAKESNIIYLAYYREILLEDAITNPNKAEGKDCIVEKAIKRSDYENHFENLDELTVFIRERLVTFVGFDFDRTLTFYHTVTHAQTIDTNGITEEKNRLFPQSNDTVINALLKEKNFRPFIATRNTKDIVNVHLKKWNWPELGVFSLSETLNKSTKLDKVPCFKDAFKEYFKQKKEEQYLDFTALRKSNIALVDCWLIDDDEDEGEIEKYGIKFIHVNNRKEPEHLKKLIEMLALDVSIELFYNTEPVPEIKINTNSPKIKGRALFTSDDDGQASPSKGPNQGKRELNPSDDSDNETFETKKLFTKSLSDTTFSIKAIASEQSSWMSPDKSGSANLQSITQDEASVSSNTPLKVVPSLN